MTESYENRWWRCIHCGAMAQGQFPPDHNADEPCLALIGHNFRPNYSEEAVDVKGHKVPVNAPDTGHTVKIPAPKRFGPVTDPTDKADKPRMCLCPVSAPVAIATVFTHGCHGRADYDWMGKRYKYSEMLDSVERHLMAYKDGHCNDPDTGLPHLWHAMARLAMLIEYEKRGIDTNDIYEHQFERQGEPKS